uniref:Uncharacterized protein n=1 Tax=Rhodopseudomonas palustris (strain BisA53) TaxID=316055 RepID=Q07NG7_RHOP5
MGARGARLQAPSYQSGSRSCDARVCDWVQFSLLKLRHAMKVRVEQENVMNSSNRRLRDHTRKLHQNERRQILAALLWLIDKDDDAISSDVENDAPVSTKQPITLKRLQ